MTKNVYQITGHFQMGRVDQKFSVQFVGGNEDEAQERLFTDFGSRHNVKRRQIFIDTIAVAENPDPIQLKIAEA